MVDEKLATELLTSSTEAFLPADIAFSFTVVPSTFNALEYTECTAYNVILSREAYEELSIFDLKVILNNQGIDIPMIMTPNEDGPEWAYLQHDPARLNKLKAVLLYPFYSIDLVNVILMSLGMEKVEATRVKAAEQLDAMEEIPFGQIYIPELDQLPPISTTSNNQDDA